jgi:trans-2,3-dihydro-3-hydroxyanthranilate isomerase
VPAVTELRYRLLNVFTCEGDPLSGNPLCVFENGAGLSTPTMQALARQFNLSETTFLTPATEPSAQAQVRIFTPSFEMPFAGHPTLGTAFVCRAMGLGGDSLRLQMKAGIIPVSAVGTRWTLTANAPTHRELTQPRAQLAYLLGLTANDIADRPLWIAAGREQLIVPLTSAAAVRRAAPKSEAFKEMTSEDGQGMAYLFTQIAPGQVLARFFFPQGVAVLEDPATGSATANLGGWWLAMERPIPASLVCSQGEQISRPSRLFLDVDQSGQIRVGGDVIELGGGSIRLSASDH